MIEFVLDASAVLAVIGGESGWQNVVPMLPRSCITTVNLSEVAAKLNDWGTPLEGARRQIDAFQMQTVAFDDDLAYLAASLRVPTRNLGLSLGDRACLALGLRADLPVISAERQWAKLDLPIRIELIR